MRRYLHNVSIKEDLKNLKNLYSLKFFILISILAFLGFRFLRICGLKVVSLFVQVPALDSPLQQLFRCYPRLRSQRLCDFSFFCG